MARLFHSGFELNDAAGSDEFGASSTGSPAVNTTAARSGTYGADINGFSSGARKTFRFTHHASANNGPLFFRFYFQVRTLPSAGNRFFAWISGTAFTGTQIVFLTLNSDGTVQLADEDGNIGSASSALSLNTWYRIEIEVNRTGSAGSHIVKARIDGTEFAAATNRSLSAGFRSIFLGGNLNLEAQTTGRWWFDDLALNNNSGSNQNSYPGDGKIIRMKPNAAGDNSDFTGSWADLDEVNPDDSGTVATSGTVGHIEDVNLEASGLSGSDVINAVAVGVRYGISLSASGITFVTRIKASSGGTVEESATISTDSSFHTHNLSDLANFSLVLYDLPGASTTAWTNTDLDAAQIGVRLTARTGGNLELTTLWLEVDYTPVGGNNYSQDVSDTVTMSESLVKSIIRTISETSTMNEALNKSTTAVRVDTSTISELLTKHLQRTISDTSNISEDFAKQIVFAISFSDTATMTDSFQKLQTHVREYIDSLSMTESLSRSTTRSISDTSNINENLATSLAEILDLSDTVAISEQVYKNTSRNISESITLSENIAKNIIKVTIDTANMSEAFTRLLSQNKELSDSVTISDSVIKYTTKAVSDSANLSEVLDRILALLKTVTDTANISEDLAASRSRLKELIDTTTITDMLTKSVSKLFSDTQELRDKIIRAVNGIVVMWNIRAKVTSIWTPRAKGSTVWTKRSKSNTTWTIRPKP